MVYPVPVSTSKRQEDSHKAGKKTSGGEESVPLSLLTVALETFNEEEEEFLVALQIPCKDRSSFLPFLVLLKDQSENDRQEVVL